MLDRTRLSLREGVEAGQYWWRLDGTRSSWRGVVDDGQY
jgi:hypothetical protein